MNFGCSKGRTPKAGKVWSNERKAYGPIERDEADIYAHKERHSFQCGF